MIALPRTRDFSARNWQILLTNNSLNMPANGVYIALTFFGVEEQSPGPYHHYSESRVISTEVGHG